METDFSPKPHQEAAKTIRDKPVVSREVSDAQPAELRGRAFTIAGVEAANVQQRVRDTLATIAEGETWDDAKSKIIEDLDPFLGNGAERRAEILLRTHGFQAFQSSNWRVAQEDDDTTHLQYMTMEDDKVRESHAALEGIVLRKDDPFWLMHFPPWEWGCRCRTRTLNPDQVDELKDDDKSRAPDDKLVMEGPALTKLREGVILRNGQATSVLPPEGEHAFHFHPDDLRIPLDELKQRYDADVWSSFRQIAQRNTIEGGVSVWDWLKGEKLPDEKPTPQPETALESQGLEEFKARMKRFKPPVIAAINKIPATVGPFVKDLQVEKVRGLAHYSLKTIHVSGNPDSWNGLPTTVLHEIGHHLHYETKTVTNAGATPEFVEAMAKDLKIFTEWAERRHPGKGLAVYRRGQDIATGQDLAKAMELELTNKPNQMLVGRVADSLSGLTNGAYGYGHGLVYMQRHSAKEVYAHAFSALMDGDPFFAKLFPNSLEIVRKSLNIL